MTKITNSIVNLIGNTPIVKLNRVVPEDAADVYVKLESLILVVQLRIGLPLP